MSALAFVVKNSVQGRKRTMYSNEAEPVLLHAYEGT